MPSLRSGRLRRPFAVDILEQRIVCDVAPPLPPPGPPIPPAPIPNQPAPVIPPAPGQPPLAVDDGFNYSIVIPESPANVLFNDLDGNPGATWDKASLTVVAPPQFGAVTLDPIAGVFLYTPNYMLPPGLPPGSGPPATPQDEFTYFVKNSLGMQSNVAKVTVAPIGNPGEANLVTAPDFGFTSSLQPITMDILANDQINDGSQFVLESVGLPPVTPVDPGIPLPFPPIDMGPKHGQVEFDRFTGKMTYTPDFGFIGWDSFQYSVSTTSGAQQSQSVLVVVSPAAPRLVDDPLGCGKMLVVDGSQSADVIEIIPGNRRGEVRAIVNGTASPAFRPDTRVLVFGHGGDDVITVHPHARASAWLVGGQGNDTLQAGTSNSLLLGSEGNDLLTGGWGRDLLIGGLGEDRLVGGPAADLMIGGSTTLDQDQTRLERVMNIWSWRPRAVRDCVRGVFEGEVGLDDGSKDVLVRSNRWDLPLGLDGAPPDDVIDLPGSSKKHGKGRARCRD